MAGQEGKQTGFYKQGSENRRSLHPFTAFADKSAKDASQVAHSVVRTMMPFLIRKFIDPLDPIFRGYNDIYHSRYQNANDIYTIMSASHIAKTGESGGLASARKLAYCRVHLAIKKKTRKGFLFSFSRSKANEVKTIFSALLFFLAPIIYFSAHAFLGKSRYYCLC